MDGTRILFHRRLAQGHWDIFVVNLDRTSRVNLTNHPALDWFPAWSPDGSRIVFTRGGYQATDADIWVMNADGNNRVRLKTDNEQTSDAQPSWRP
jgi:TolB protein